MLWKIRLNQMLARLNLELRRHPAARRQQLFKRFETDLVLDVGAAAGGYAVQARAFGYSGRIVSFEPLNDSFRRLRAAAKGDRSWEAVQCALGDRAGTAEIFVASNRDSSSLLPMLAAHRSAVPHVSDSGKELVQVRRLDDVSPAYLETSRSSFLKIDTQGFERAVLAGGSETVKRLSGLQLELSLIPLYEGAMLVDEAVAWAYDEGFRLVGLEAGHTTPYGQLIQCDGVFMRSGLLEIRSM